MGSRTNIAELKKGLAVSDPELSASSVGSVDQRVGHVPDLALIDSKNTLPTQDGYISYFGYDDKLEITPLTAQAQKIITYRTLHGDNIQVAFCADGLYLRALAGDGAGVLTNVPAAGGDPAYYKLDLVDKKAAWIRIFATIPLSPWRSWTWALLENKLYILQKGMNFIGKLTSYAPDQIIVEQLSPTYILASRERHIFTITSEDSSTDDTSWKSVTLTTDTGLNFGVQKILVNSASEVSRAIEAWKVVLEVTGFFVMDSTETLRVETPIDATIPISNKTQAELQAIVDATMFDADDSDLKLEVFWTP